MGNKKGLFYLLVLVAIVIITAVAYFGFNDDQAGKETEVNKEETFDPKADPNAEQITYYDNERKFAQTKIEEDLLKEYKEGNHSFEEPYMVADPYGVAPLTVLVKFETEEPVQISVTVEGKDDKSDITKTYEGYNQEHEIPVLGLYADYENTVTLQATNEDGDNKETELSIQTDELPDDLLKTDLVEADKEKMENGLTFTIPSEGSVFAVDANANVRWYSTLPTRHVFNRLDNGNVLYITQDDEQDQYNELLEMDMLGKIANSYKIQIDGYEGANLLHHDVIEMPNGDLLATSHEPESEYVEDQMTEIDRETGETLRHFNIRDLFPEESYEQYDGKNAEDGDWFHQNAIWFDENDNTFLISGRSQDVIIKHSYPDGEIKWILGTHEEWPEEYDQYLLEPKGDSVKFPAGQHAMKTLPDLDDNAETTDVLLFDNNDVITRGDEEVSGDYSRAVQYRINEKEMTVEEVWSYGEDRGTSFFSSIVGNTQYLYDTGNRLITSGYIEDPEDEDKRFSNIVEVNDQNPAEVVYEITTESFEGGVQIYRAIRMPLYPEQDWNFNLTNEE